jgi:hypothetical protein
MCDFKVGDEVVCVDAAVGAVRCGNTTGLEKGKVYVVLALGLTIDGQPGVDVGGRNVLGGFNYAYRFRKVQRRDLGAWLKTETTFEEPKRTKVDA